MAEPCTEIERIVKSETLIIEHGRKLDCVDAKIDRLLDITGTLKNNRGFIGGIAAAGWLVGALMCDMAKPFVKAAIVSMTAVLK